jgi:hypothetical protein
MSKLFGVFDEDGYLLFFGRSSDNIIKQDENAVELEEKPIPGLLYRLIDGVLQQIEGD